MFLPSTTAGDGDGSLHRRGSVTKRDAFSETDHIMIILWVFVAISLVVVFLRVAVRLKTMSKLFWDDWWMILSVALSLAYQAMMQEFVRDSKKLISLGLARQTGDLKWGVIAAWISLIYCVTARISIAILLARIFSSVTWFKWYLYVVTSIFAITAIVSLALYVEAVKPVIPYWDHPWSPIPESAEIHDPGLPFLVFSMLDFAFAAWSDLTFVLIPVLLVWRMSLPLQKKAGLIAVLLLSLATMGMAIMKAVSITIGIRQFSAAQRLLWSGLEGSFVIILGSLLPLMPLGRGIQALFQRVIDSVLSKSRSSNGSPRTRSRSTDEHVGGSYQIPKTIGSLNVRQPRQVDEYGLTRTSEELHPPSRTDRSTNDSHSSDERSTDWENNEKQGEPRTLEMRTLP